jgi:ribose 5-phosphate isomerase B
MMENKTIAFACDHGGFSLKEPILAYLKGQGWDVIDFGTWSDERCDYPQYAEPACRAVTEGKASLAVLVCGTGIGMSLAANKIRGIRAACCSEPYSAEMTRRHNDANVLCIGARVVGEGLALTILEAFLTHAFEGGRHAGRVAMLRELEDRF